VRRARLAGQVAEPISHNSDAVERSGFPYIPGMLPVNADGELVGTGRDQAVRGGSSSGGAS
jgi:hypothetical protein